MSSLELHAMRRACDAVEFILLRVMVRAEYRKSWKSSAKGHPLTIPIGVIMRV